VGTRKVDTICALLIMGAWTSSLEIIALACKPEKRSLSPGLSRSGV